MSGFLDDFDPGALAGTGVVDEPESERSALQEVATRISAQYGQVIATWASQVLSTAEPVQVVGMQATVTNLLRLARSSANGAQVVLLEDLLDVLSCIEGTRPRTRLGDGARIRLRDWIPSFADTLLGDDAEQLRALVVWDPGSVPFLDELRDVRGIGPRRLTRLYSAGLGNLDSVANADPVEVAQVTGIPYALAHEVVLRARSYGLSERVRCVQDIRDRAARLKMLLTHIEDDPNSDLLSAARDALAHVEGAFNTLFSDQATPEANP